jgi:hypothetical protein
VVPVIARRLREWPRATVAVVVLAIGLVLIGVLVASTGSGGAAHAASRSQPAHSESSASASAAGRSAVAARGTINRLQASLRRDSDQLAAARSALATSQAATRCWQGKAHHPRKERAVQCPQGSSTP